VPLKYHFGFSYSYYSTYFQQTNLLKQVDTSIEKSKNQAELIVLLGSKPTFTNYKPVLPSTTYYSNTYLDGRVKFEKDLEHTIGYTATDPQKQHATSPLLGKWTEIKAGFYNLPDGSVRAMDR
jgi:hypothetical protein